MIIEGNDGRIALNLTEDEALDMIQKLTKAVAHSRKFKSAWFAEGVVYTANDKSFAGRMTFRVEG